MSPSQFLTALKKQIPSAVFFLGPELYQRRRCRSALVDAVLPNEEARENGYTILDLSEVSLVDVLDEAGAMSLFSAERLIVVRSAELALPRGKSVTKAEEFPGIPELLRFVASPPPGVTVLFDVSRYELDGEDKTRVENLRKLFACVPALVEFPRLTADAARVLAKDMATAKQVKIAPAALELLIEACGADASRLEQELEKLALYAGPGGSINESAVAALAPNARTADVFALVAALGRGDRMGSLELIHTLLREGEYLPLALQFAGTQFRLALAASESGARSSSAIQQMFQTQGMAMWKARADQVEQTVRAFSAERLKMAIRLTMEADSNLKSNRPDDATILEQYVLKLTEKTEEKRA
jgi:DNA polymerase III subunit delta